MRTMRLSTSIATATLALAALAAPLTAQNLVTNGGFENGFSGWTGSGGACGASLFAPGTGGSIFTAGFSHASCTSPLYQYITTTPGQLYEFSFFARDPVAGGSNNFTASANGTSIYNNALSNGTFQQFTGQFTAPGTSSTISFAGHDEAGGITEFDDVSVTAVTTTPEPGSLALLGTGLVGLVPLIRRRRA